MFSESSKNTQDNGKVEYLGFKGCALTEDQLEKIISKLGHLTELVAFDITECDVSADNIHRMFESQSI